MAKFYGKIGYASTVETSPGIWEEIITERNYTGDLIRNTRKIHSGDKVNSDINISNEVSIIADRFAADNIGSMRYVMFMNNKWRIESVDIQYPRMTLTIGGLYND